MSSNVHALEKIRPLRSEGDGLTGLMSKPRFEPLFDGPAMILNAKD